MRRIVMWPVRLYNICFHIISQTEYFWIHRHILAKISLLLLRRSWIVQRPLTRITGWRGTQWPAFWFPPPRCRWHPRNFGILLSAEWQFIYTGCTGQICDPIFRVSSRPRRTSWNSSTRSPSVLRLPWLARCGMWNFLRDTGVVHRITHSLHYLFINSFLSEVQQLNLFS
jgi:hypothetical protein